MIAAFALYFVTLTGIGIYFYHRNKYASDYIIGNRSVNYWVTAIATQASDMGSWLFMGFPAAVYAAGLFEFWTAIGLTACMLLNWVFIAPRLRAQTEQYNALTLSTFFERRLQDSSGMLRSISAAITIYFFTCYIASGVVALGRLFEAAFGIDYFIGAVLGLLAGVLFTLIGGFLAVAWCNLFQGLFLLAMILIVPIYGTIYCGGIGAVLAATKTYGVSLSLISQTQSIIAAISLALGWGLGYFGQPHILINFMGIDDPKNIRAATWVGISWQILVLSAATAIGLIGVCFFNHAIANPELIFIDMAKTLFPPFIAGLVLCAILAATLSTMDNHILISGSTFAEDIYLTCINKQATQKHLILVSRIMSLAVACYALYIASDNSSSVYKLVNYAWSGIGSAFGPIVILSLYTSTLTRNGALLGMLSGALIAGMWPWFNSSVLPMVPGFFSALALAYGLSWYERARTRHF
jgi:sodium/proline symporter